MLKKIFILLLLQVGIYNMYAQNVQRLETNPSFKGISIGMPISSIADELTYELSMDLHCIDSSGEAVPPYHSKRYLQIIRENEVPDNLKVVLC